MNSTIDATTLTSFEENVVDQKSCPICFKESTLVETVSTINPNSDKRVDLCECISCGHWWNSPLPNQELLNSFYESGSEYVVPKDYKEKVAEATEVSNEVLWNKVYTASSQYSEKIKADNKDFNFLEIGVGSGQLFNFFKQKAKVAYGVEPGNWVVGTKENIVHNIQELPHGITFDMIVIHGVMEHLSNPSDMLLSLSALANPGCVIHSTYPNKDTLKAKIQKGKWHMVRPFGHLHYFSAGSLKKMFEKSGWEVLELNNCRISEESALDLAKKFDFSRKHIIYRLIKSLFVGQILLGKDQWTVIAKKV